jgi:hypothetical protein
LRLDKGQKFSGPVYVACEGDADQYFLCKLLDHHQITGVDVAIVGGNGERFTKHLEGLLVADDFKKLSTIVLMTDGDLNVQARFMAACNSLTANGFIAPTAPWTVAKQNGHKSTAVLTLPSAQSTGTLETLLVDALFGSRPQVEGCLDAFSQCMIEPEAWDGVKKAKMRFHASVAALCSDGPGTAASRIWSATHNPVPIASNVFLPLAQFFKDLDN